MKKIIALVLALVMVFALAACGGSSAPAPAPAAEPAAEPAEPAPSVGPDGPASWETGILLATLGHEAHAILIIVLGVISYVNLSLRKRK